ncbi:MAG: sugar-transporting ATPase [Verrucomicrobiaceae bacterium]|nr:sugar-transporting ATPase [Verrucomicrobiaceae bacterium]
MRSFLQHYGMLVVLLALGICFSVATLQEQPTTGEAAGRLLAAQIWAGHVLVVARGTTDDIAFANALADELKKKNVSVEGLVTGEPRDARKALTDLNAKGQKLDTIALNQTVSHWILFDNVATDFPALGSPLIVKPKPVKWPVFLNRENLVNIANQIAVIAIVAIGMTMVIITGGIDLSVGSLIALSAVIVALIVRDYAGAEHASAAGMFMAGIGAMAACGLVGAGTGVVVTRFGIPPFIVTLAVMLVASGLAYLLAQGQSVYQVPESFIWLGRGADIAGVPNAVLLMLVLYALAHLFMKHTAMGRYLYAVGGNKEAATVSGLRVNLVLVFAYTISGLLAGLGGVIMASQLRSGSPTYGQMYELYVIAAVVVGGASLSGGRGRMFGTLIGALIIAVIQNGMNLTNIESYTQKVVLGLVILGAVMLDQLKAGRARH